MTLNTVACANKHCPYIARYGSSYCCDPCSNSAVAGTWEYSYHSDLRCDRERSGSTDVLRAHTYAPDHFHRNLLVGAAMAIAIIILLFGFAISLGAK